jgi:serine/threonine protein kinase
MSSGDHLNTFLPTDLGPFRLLDRLGLGGHGTVYLGERREGFSQRVAIKLLHATDRTPFREQFLLASLDHPNIVRLLDQGVSDQGRHYLVMEYIEGASIDKFCDMNRLSLDARIKLMRKVMGGVSFAHLRLIVHADLKPSNILIDSSGEPKLLDFGIATLLDEDLDSSVPSFTPAFASPEQKRQQSVTIASDVYALGVLCTLLLVGSVPPTDPDGSMQPGTELLARADVPGLKRIAEERSTGPSALRRAISGDLDAIIAKALQPNPEERYHSVETFSEDLHAHLESRTITARPAKLTERLQKWIVRHWALATAAMLVSAAILISVAGVTVQMTRAEYQRRLAQGRLQELVRLTSSLDGELYASVKSLPRSDAAQRSLLDSATRTLDKLANDSSGDPVLSVELAAEYTKLGRLEKDSNILNGKEQRSRALVDARKAISVLQQLPKGTQSTPEARRQFIEAFALRLSVL